MVKLGWLHGEYATKRGICVPKSIFCSTEENYSNLSRVGQLQGPSRYTLTSIRHSSIYIHPNFIQTTFKYSDLT